MAVDHCEGRSRRRCSSPAPKANTASHRRAPWPPSACSTGSTTRSGHPQARA